MKRIIILLLSLSLLVACVPTPETKFVVNKGDVTIETDVPDAEVRDVLDGVPKRWEAEFSYREGTVKVQIDAEIETPDVGRFPIVEVAPASIDPQIAAKLLYKLIPGGSIRISDRGGKPYTLEDVDQWIEEVKQQLAHTDEMAFASDEDRDAYIDAQNAELSRLFEMRKTAESGEVTSFSAYELLARYGTTECGVLDADGMECAVLMWKPQADEKADKRESVLHIDSLLPSCTVEGIRVESKEDALKAADALIEEIELSDCYACVSQKDGPNAILCYYGRVYGGVKSSPLVETVLDGAAYRMPWPNEMLLVRFVKSDGRVSVSYVCPSDTVGEIGNAELLSFEEIQAQFEKNMKASYAWFDERTVSAAITVDRISLGYYRVPMKDAPNRYALIPAWTFLGKRTVEEPSDGGDGTTILESDLKNGVLMILSGLDGSLLYAG